MDRTGFLLKVFVTSVLALLSACGPKLDARKQCPSVAGRSAVEDADQDFKRGERYLITFVEGGNAAIMNVEGFKERNCNYIMNNRGSYLRTNKRFRQTAPTGDCFTQEQLVCEEQEPRYAETYNRELMRLDPRSFDSTCSTMTLSDARRQFGNVAEQYSKWAPEHN